MADFLQDVGFPNTQSNIEAGNRTNTGLSTQIIIKVSNDPVGALQNLSVSQNRRLQRVVEVGTDGVIEIIPNAATEYELSATRVVFDQLRLPEAFSRGFRFIAAQRIPFDIDIIDISGADPNANKAGTDENKTIMTYKNCWFTRYDTPYQADNYVVTETATMWCETAYLSQVGRDGPANSSLRRIQVQTDGAGVEAEVNSGRRRGALDAAGIVMSLFEGETL